MAKASEPRELLMSVELFFSTALLISYALSKSVFFGETTFAASNEMINRFGKTALEINPLCKKLHHPLVTTAIALRTLKLTAIVPFPCELDSRALSHSLTRVFALFSLGRSGLSVLS